MFKGVVIKRAPVSGGYRDIVDWTRESRRWHKKFKITSDKSLIGLEDARIRTQVEQRALRLLHAI